MNHTEAIQAAPPVSVVGLSLFGVPLSEWVYVATLIYTVFLIVDKLPVVACRLRQMVRRLKERNVKSDDS